MFRQVAISVLPFMALLGCVAPERGSDNTFEPAYQNITVLDIIDGDTIRIVGSNSAQPQNARLVGFDTPEVFDPGCPEELALGNAATGRLQVILHDAIAIDSRTIGTDRYDRVLLRLTIDGRDLADIMVSEGLAVRYAGGRRINWCNRLATP